MGFEEWSDEPIILPTITAVWTPAIKIQQPRYLRTIARLIIRLPVELVWLIIEDLTIFRVFQLGAALVDSTYFDRCVLGQTKYQRLLQTVEQLRLLRDVFVLNYEIAHIMNGHDRQSWRPLGFLRERAGTEEVGIYHDEYDTRSDNLRLLTYDTLWSHLNASVVTKFQYLWLLTSTAVQHNLEWDTPARLTALRSYLHIHYRQDLPAREAAKFIYDCTPPTDRYVLTHNTIGWFDYGKVNLRSPLLYWDQVLIMENHCPLLIRTAAIEMSIYTDRGRQLSRLADIFQNNAAILKRSGDPRRTPGEDQCRYGRHITHELRVAAFHSYRYGQQGRDRLRYVGDFLFRYDMLPLVPFDRYLELFVQTYPSFTAALPATLQTLLDKSDGAPISTTDVHGPSQLLALSQSLSLTSICLPLNLVTDLNTVTRGMAHVYTVKDKATGITPRVLRTRYTPWSAPSWRTPFPAPNSGASSEQQRRHAPIFMSPPMHHLRRLTPEKIDGHCLRWYLPSSRNVHAEQELEWLEAFCRVVKLMQRYGQRHAERPWWA